MNRIRACLGLSSRVALHRRVLTTSVMSEIVVPVDFRPKLPLAAEICCFFFLCTHPFSVDLALPTGARALSRIYICTISAGLLSTFTRALSTCPSAPGLFNYVGSPPFNPFLALSLKMERPCSPSWKRKSVICRGSVGRHLG